VSVCVFILVGGIDRFTVLVVAERMVEREKLDSDLRDRLQETEAYVHRLEAELANVLTGEAFDRRRYRSHNTG